MFLLLIRAVLRRSSLVEVDDKYLGDAVQWIMRYHVGRVGHLHGITIADRLELGHQ